MQSNLLQKAARATLLAALFSTGVGSAVAWTGPSTAPPNGNTSSPINVSATAQTKTASFNISLPAAYGNWGINVSGGNYGVIGQASAGQGIYGTSVSNWAGYFTGAYGVYSANNAGYYTELDNSSYGVLTNGDVCTSGYCLNAVGARTSVAFGGMWEEYSNGVALVYNPWTGGLSCPGFAPTAREAAVGASGNGTWPFYLYYCTG